MPFVDLNLFKKTLQSISKRFNIIGDEVGDEEAMELMKDLDAIMVVADEDGSILTDEDGDIILW